MTVHPVMLVPRHKQVAVFLLMCDQPFRSSCHRLAVRALLVCVACGEKRQQCETGGCRIGFDRAGVWAIRMLAFAVLVKILIVHIITKNLPVQYYSVMLSATMVIVY